MPFDPAVLAEIKALVARRPAITQALIDAHPYLVAALVSDAISNAEREAVIALIAGRNIPRAEAALGVHGWIKQSIAIEQPFG